MAFKPARILSCLTLGLLLAALMHSPAWTKVMLVPFRQMIQEAEFIVIARVVRVKVLGDEKSNTLVVEKALKGDWPVKKPLVVMTHVAWREDALSLGPPGFRAVLFLIKDPQGKVIVLHAAQGMWPLEGDTPAGIGLGGSLDRLRDEIKRQSQPAAQP